MLRSPYLIALLITVLGASTYWYRLTAAECPVPLSYRIGEIDPSFELSREAAQLYITQAEAVWEDAVGRELFIYDDSTDFTIDFVYDERQAAANSEAAQRSVLDEQREENERILAAVAELQQEHASLAVSYERRVAAYEARLDAYNAEVTKYNDRGGAPPEVFEGLEAERTELEATAQSLSKTAAELNQLASELNQLSNRGNDLVERYNKDVVEYNEAYGYSREFTQGDYQGNNINVYKFSNDAEVVTVLAHEFGHALGLGHVEGPSSLMYYLLDEVTTVPELSEDDRAAYQAVCGDAESFAQWVRRQIRQLIN